MLDKYIRTKVFSYVYSVLVLAVSVIIILNGWDGFSEAGIIIVNQNLYTG